MSDNLKIVLASASPRRTELLKSDGIPHTVMATDADETPRGAAPDGVPSAAWYAAEASLMKADAAADMLCDSVGRIIVISADTVVSPDGRRIFGKPRDHSDAREMLRTLSGTVHSVVGGVTLTELRNGGEVRRICESCTTRVSVSRLTERQIDAYIASGEPFGKAGAYAIQGLASQFVLSVDGDYANVVGISVALVTRLLREHFFVEPTDFGR